MQLLHAVFLVGDVTWVTRVRWIVEVLGASALLGNWTSVISSIDVQIIFSFQKVVVRHKVMVY
jgi:hypothetical protein